MNPQTIGRIDRRIGKPICWLLTAARRVGELFARLFGRGGATERPVRRILFIKMIEQGATVLAYRAIATAVEKVGVENVYFWVFAENRPILDLLQVIPPENVIPINAKKPVRLFLGMIGTLWKIRKLRIDATVDMEFFSRASAILAFLTGARVRVGLHRFTSEGPYRGDLLTRRVQYNPYLHTAVMYYVLVQAIWADPKQTPLLKVPAPAIDATPPPFIPRQGEAEEVRAIVNRLAGTKAEGPIVLLNPNASDLLPLRKWPTDRFIELGRRLLREQPNAWLVITGAPSEREAAQDVADDISDDDANSDGNADPEINRCFCIAGHTTLRQLMVLYTLADVLVTNDSGPGHFSSMTNVETVVLFGPETPALYGPLGKHTHVIWENLACSPCVNVLNHRFSPCNDNVCMQRITVEQVCAKVIDLLNRRNKPEDERSESPDSSGFKTNQASGDSLRSSSGLVG